MNKIKEILSVPNFVLITLILMGLKSLSDANVAQALIVMSFAGLHGYRLFLDSKVQKDINADIQKEISEIRSHVTALTLKNGIRQSTTSNEAKRFF